MDVSPQELWDRWTADHDPASREALVRHYWPLVRSVAKATKRPAHLPVDEMVSHASLGLLAALDRYDPAKGPFESYARARMKGAIIEGIRVHDRASRANLDRSKALDAATDTLTSSLHRAPTEDELAAGLGVTRSKMVAYHQSRLATSIGTLDADTDGDHRWRVGDQPSSQDVPIEVEHRLRQSALASALEQIDGPDRAVMVLYYVKEMTMAEIGAVLGVATARVSQIHSRAVRTLKHHLQPALPVWEDDS